MLRTDRASNTKDGTIGGGGQLASEPNHLPDETIRRCIAGDVEAFGEVVRTFYRSIYQLCRYLTRSEADADDAVQETFLRAFRAIRRFRGEARLKTWLFRICMNACSDVQGRSKVEAQSVSANDAEMEQQLAAVPSPGPSPRDLAVREELRRQVRAAVSRLPESHKRVVLLVAFEGLSHEEAARVLGLRTATVTWYMQESRKRLRTILARSLDR